MIISSKIGYKSYSRLALTIYISTRADMCKISYLRLISFINHFLNPFYISNPLWPYHNPPQHIPAYPNPILPYCNLYQSILTKSNLFFIISSKIGYKSYSRLALIIYISTWADMCKIPYLRPMPFINHFIMSFYISYSMWPYHNLPQPSRSLSQPIPPNSNYPNIFQPNIFYHWLFQVK